MRLATILFMFLLVMGPALAGEADVVGVKASRDGEGRYSFRVTVRHGDTGWKHYANKWDVVGSSGKVFGTRVLYHPHETEQPFTRSLSGVVIPDDVRRVMLRAHDSVHEYGGKTFEVTLPR
jgi:hypothetical protein